MNRLYSSFVLLLSALLLLIFHGKALTRFWNTELTTTGHYYQESFLNGPIRPVSPELKQLGGTRLKIDKRQVVYRFTSPQQARLYLQPTLAKQSSLQDQSRNLVNYRPLNTLRLRLPRSGQEQVLFSVSDRINQRIDLSPYIQDVSVFELVLDDSGPASERVMGSLEISLIDQPLDEGVPILPLLFLLWVAPLIWSWFCHSTLGFSLASSLGLALSCTLLAHILGLLKPELMPSLLLGSLLAPLLLLALHSWLEGHALPSAPFFWGILYLAIELRWQEIVIQAAKPLDLLPQAQLYYQHAITMDLFSSKGFFAALFQQGPFYPFLIKLAGYLFGFSPWHMFYVSLAGALVLLVLSYRLACLLLGERPQALLVMLILALNTQLIHESGLRSPDIISACLGLTLLLLVFSYLRHQPTRGLLRGLLLAFLIWTHLSFFPLALILLGIDCVYQVKRTHSTSSWAISLRATLVSAVIVMAAFMPCLLQNAKVYGSYFPESTTYVSLVGNLEFSDRAGFPASLDVTYAGEKADHYRRLSIREYFLDYHSPSELLGGGLLGFCLLSLDSLGSLLNLARGENILSLLIQGLSLEKGLLPIVLMFLAEIFSLLFLVVFAWFRFRRYRLLLLIVALLLLPHAFFYGIFLLKGYSLIQGQLDQQAFLVILPILAIMLVDALAWMRRHRGRWLV